MEKLYVEIASQVEKLISEGALRPGDRLPSVRKLSKEQKVSVSTVLQSYFLLESRGLIEAKPQSGFYVRPRRELPPEPAISAPNRSAARVGVGELVMRIFEAERDPKVIRLASASPSTSLMPVAALQRAMTSSARKLGPAALNYELPPGNATLRREIARRSLASGVAISPEDVVITVGGMEALNLCLRAVAKPGDAVAIESPTYYGILQVLESLQMRAVEIPTHPRTGICLDALEQALSRQSIKAAMVMPSFNNPLGSCMPEENKKELVRMLGSREIPLIEDDAYGELHFGDSRPRTCQSFDRKGLVLFCSSFSKVLAPGYRVGWAVPGKFKDRVENLKFMSTIATATLPQIAIGEFLGTGGYDRHLRKLRAVFRQHLECYTDVISRAFPAGTRVTRPSGGFVLWIELPESSDSLELHSRALAQGISIAPGPIFSAKGRFRNCIRVNCGQPLDARVESALEKLGRLAAAI